jgi:hypothetical protein
MSGLLIPRKLENRRKMARVSSVGLAMTRQCTHRTRLLTLGEVVTLAAANNSTNCFRARLRRVLIVPS